MTRVLDQDVEARRAELLEALGPLDVTLEQLIVAEERSRHGPGEREEVGRAVLVHQVGVAAQDLMIRRHVHRVVLKHGDGVARDLTVLLVQVVALGIALVS